MARIIRISEYSLEAFAVYDNDFYDVTLLPLAAANNVIIECKERRKFTLDDMAMVLEKLISNKTDASAFFFTWFEPLIINFYDALMLNRLFGDYPSAIDAYRLKMMPQSDDDLLRWILSYILSLYREMSLMMTRTPAADYIGAEELLRMIDLQTVEGELPIEERTYIDEIKDSFVKELDNDLILKDSDRFTKKLFTRYVNELCDKNNYNALRIKGFACLGGNSVFKCDFKEAARCMEILWKDAGYGYAANTLGFIHYEGRLTGGVPDLGKAFSYFSIGHTYGISESTYKLAEMFTDGLYVAKNMEMAATLIEKLYIDSRIRFEQEDFECTFAEAASYMGKLQYRICAEKTLQFGFMRDQALDFFLQAAFALNMRSQFGFSQGDRNLKEQTDAMIAELTEDMKIYKKSYTSSYPVQIKDFIAYKPYGRYLLTIKELKNSRIKISIFRLPSRSESQPGLTLLTYREFLCCTLTDNVMLTANNAVLSVKTKSGDILFDDLSIETFPERKRTCITFFSGDKEAARIEAESFTITRP